MFSLSKFYAQLLKGIRNHQDLLFLGYQNAINTMHGK
jgi:hypothetical protein